MTLKRQDVLVLLKLALLDARGESWTFMSLSGELGLSVSEVHGAVERLKAACLLRSIDRMVRRASLLEFLVHGVKYCFPVQLGPLTRGVPTSYAAPPLDQQISPGDDPVPVWPDKQGTVRGLTLEPLYHTVPQAAAKDPELHELLALLDAIRTGSSRERTLAEQGLEERLLIDAK